MGSEIASLTALYIARFMPILGLIDFPHCDGPQIALASSILRVWRIRLLCRARLPIALAERCSLMCSLMESMRFNLIVRSHIEAPCRVLTCLVSKWMTAHRVAAHAS